jgi:TatD DNase family protein
LNIFADTHCHLNFEIFKNDLAEVILRAENQGITQILVPGFDIASSMQAVDLANRFPLVYAAVGIHPNEVTSWDSNSLSDLIKLCANPKVVAIGEIGLDLHRNPANIENQQKAFEQQLSIACDLKLPVLIHNRSTSNEILEILKKFKLKGIFHAFDGDLQILEYAIENGYFFGIGGSITYSKSKIDKQVLEQIWNYAVFETDSPFLTPNPFRGKRNEPSNIKTIVEFSAKIINTQLYDLARMTSKNANSIFNWNQIEE